MENIIPLCQLILKKAKEKYGFYDSNSSLEEEANIAADEVLCIIENLVSNNFPSLTHETLDLLDEYEVEEDSATIDDDKWRHADSEADILNNTGSQQSQLISQEWEVKKMRHQTYTLEEMQKVLEYYDTRKIKKMQQTTKRFPFVTNRVLIHRFRKYVNQHGTKREKFLKMEGLVYEKFLEARSIFASVSEKDLKRWGHVEAKKLNLSFAASEKWIFAFKKRHRIVSRKITKFTTNADIQSLEDIEHKAKTFVDMVKEKCSGIPSKSIWNFDQSGFNYEHANSRTLTTKGEAVTAVKINSRNAISHSYTIMPLISMNGRLAPKLLLCLQETTGRFGPNVTKNLQVPNNIQLYCSKSGKLTKELMKKWIDEYAKDFFTEFTEVVLIHDSWTGQTDPEVYSSISNLMDRFQIPAKTTSLAQPLDVYFFRQYKIIRRQVFDRMALEMSSINLHSRENIIKMHSLIYNQLQSPKFVPMLTYPWFACGYVENRSGHFLNVNELLFDNSDPECDVDECEEAAFLTCSHCSENLCINHFFVYNHYHEIQ